MSNKSSSDDLDASEMNTAEQHTVVRERYGNIASDSGSCCGDTSESSCCDDTGPTGTESEAQSRLVGYSDSELESVPDGANLGLGCGNPTAIASLEEGETVLDLGSGAGFDCFLAAREVGNTGRVIGVDMTPEMIEKARENAAEHGADAVEFRLGEIEHLPVADASVDVIISNCVINLSPNKQAVFDDAYRVLKPGGRLAISDVVVTTSLPEHIKRDPDSVAGCVGGASTISELETMLDDAGFTDISIDPKEESEEFIRNWDDDRDLSEYIVSATIEGRKPAQ